jgi:Domain of unknown function (DUF4282)
MAGQPPDGSWQSPSPNGQPGPEQVRVAWQPPQAQQQQPYGQGQPFEQGQAFGHEQAYGQAFGQEQAYGQSRPYPQQPPYAPASGGYNEAAMADQHTQTWEPGAQQAGWPPPPAGNPAFVARQRHVSRQKGFVASLFDLSFSSFVTPRVIKGLYVLTILWVLFLAVFLLLVAVHLGGANAATIIFALISLVVFILLSLGSVRMFLELFMALHRINENIQALRDRDRDEAR